MKKFLAITGCIFAIVVGDQLVTWLIAYRKVYTEGLFRGFFDVTDTGIYAYPEIFNFLLLAVGIYGFFIGFLFYKLKPVVAGIHDFVERRLLERRQLERRQPERVQPEPTQSERAQPQSRQSERVQSQPRQSERVQSEPRQPERVQSEPRRSERRQSERRQPVSKQLNDWRADATILQVFSKNSRILDSNPQRQSIVTIDFYDNRNFAFSERLASAFELTGWQVKFCKTAQTSFISKYCEHVKLKGDNPELVKPIAAVLKSSGCFSVKTDFLTSSLSYYNSITHQFFGEKLSSRSKNDLQITVGYGGLGLDTIANEFGSKSRTR